MVNVNFVTKNLRYNLILIIELKQILIFLASAVASINLAYIDEQPPNSNPEITYNQGLRNATLVLIGAYNIYRNEDGSYGIRNLKRVWQKNSDYILQKTGIKISSSTCENGWTVWLEIMKNMLIIVIKLVEKEHIFNLRPNKNNFLKEKKYLPRNIINFRGCHKIFRKPT